MGKGAEPLRLPFRDREAWRRWLEKNHASVGEVWVVYFKKGSGKPSLTYQDALQEALCFGWIDGVRKRVDDHRFMQRFTPRVQGSKWSEANRRHAVLLIREGKMTAAGLARLPGSPEAGPATPPPTDLPPELEAELRRHRKAWDNFRGLAPSYRRLYVRWILSAKRPETRARRLAEAVEKLSRNEKLGMK